MIKLYTWKTPNGLKPLIMLEELGLDYELIKIPLDGSQKKPAFLKINPNGRIPALVDDEFNVFESGAILTYLAEKENKFYGNTLKEKSLVMQWLMFQMGGIGPMFGQFNHFNMFAKEKIEYGIQRYKDESVRLLKVLDERLSQSKYLATKEYTIADMATYPWVEMMRMFVEDIVIDLKYVNRWLDEIREREAVKKVYNIEF